MPVAKKAAATEKAAPKTLEAIINQVNKTRGPGTILRGSEINFEAIPRLTSGSFALDTVLGGGWPINKWAEIYGEFSTGKTTIVHKTIAANQALDSEFTTWWLAAEDYEPDLADMCGVDRSRVILHETNVMQDGLQKIIEVCETRQVDCVVIDSYPALVPAEEDDADLGEWSTGLAPRLNNQFWRKQGPATKRSLVSMERPMIGFVINQPREKIGVTYGSNETTPGGRGKNFYYYIRLQLRRAEWIEIGPKNAKEKIGQVIRATTVKNKSARPMRSAEWDFYFEDIIDPASGEVIHFAGDYDVLKEIVDVSVAYDVIRPGGGGMYYFGEESFKGRDAIYGAMRENEILREALAAEAMQVVTRGRALRPTDSPPAKKAPTKRAAKAVPPKVREKPAVGGDLGPGIGASVMADKGPLPTKMAPAKKVAKAVKKAL